MDIILQIGATEKFTGGSDAYVHQVKEVDVKGKDKDVEVATLHLPAGHWVVSAKAVLHAASSSLTVPKVVRCRLTVSSVDRLGVAEDRAANSVTPEVVAEGVSIETQHYETTALLLGVDLKSGGYVRLFADSEYFVKLTDIVISAIRVNSLTIETI